MRQLKNLSVEGIAIMLEDINKSLLGSNDSLMAHDHVMKIGERPEDRYDVLMPDRSGAFFSMSR